MNQSKFLELIQIYHEQKNFDEAIQLAEILEQSLDAYDFIQLLPTIGKIYFSKGWYNGNDQNFISSKDYFYRYLTNTDLDLEDDKISDSLIGICKASIQLQLYQEALTVLDELEIFARKKELPDILIHCKLLYTNLPLQYQQKFDTNDILNECLQLLESADIEKKNELKAEIFTQISNLYIKKQDYNKIHDFNDWLLNYALDNNDIEKRISTQNNLGISEAVNGNFKSAIEYFMNSLELSREINHDRFAAQCLINIGTIHASLFNFKDALKRYFTIIDDYSAVIDVQTKTIIFHNIGNIYYHSSDFNNSYTFFSKALELAKLCKYEELIGATLAHLADVYTESNHLEKAERTLNESDLYIDETRNNVGIQIHHFVKGKLLIKKKLYDEALKHINISIQKAKTMKDPGTELKGLRYLSDIYAELGDFQNARKYQSEFSKIFHQHASLQYRKQLIDLEIKYELKEKQELINRLSKENEFQAKLIEQSEKINKQNEMLTEAIDDLKQFAYIVSHDLKEPVRMITSFSNLLSSSLPKDLISETERTYFNYIFDGAKRINVLIDELMKYTLISQKEHNLDVIDLNEIVNFTIDNLNVYIKENNAKISVGVLPSIMGNKSLLIQVFQNLIINAIKFRKDTEDPIIEIDSYEEENNVFIKITDNGIGIDENYLELIFALFHRLHTKNNYEGTGMGLAIVSKIVKKLNGKIVVNSVVNEGTTFTLQFPKI